MRDHFAKNLLTYIFKQIKEVYQGQHYITISGNDREQRLRILNEKPSSNKWILQSENTLIYKMAY